MTPGQQVVALVVATVLGSAVGLERELNAQAAGFRTHVLVALGSCAFTVVGANVDGSDPTRVAAQVVTGIGFLGAGAILHDGASVRGLTTAASLWVTAASGVACGLGRYAVGLVTALLTVGVLVGLKALERGVFPRRRGHVLTLVLDATADTMSVMGQVRAVVGAAVTVRRVGLAEREGTTLELSSPLRPGQDRLALAVGLRALPGVVGVELGA